MNVFTKMEVCQNVLLRLKSELCVHPLGVRPDSEESISSHIMLTPISHPKARTIRLQSIKKLPLSFSLASPAS